MRLAARLSPAGREVWAAAMAAELDYIGSDGQAFCWALGCAAASGLERLRAGTLLDLRYVRWGVALWTACQAGSALCDASLAASYKFQLVGLTQLLRCEDVRDFANVIPVLDATHLWEVSLGALAGILYSLATLLILKRSRYAIGLFASALIVGGGVWLYELSKPLYFHAFAAGDHVRDALVYAGSALVGWTVWRGAQAARALAP